MAFNIKLYKEIYDDIKSYIIAHQDIVSDFTEGGVLASEIEAFAREMAIVYTEARAGFSEAVLRLPYSIFDITRHDAQYATGVVVFGRNDTSEELVIPIGVQVATPSGITFETTEAKTMAEGVSSISVVVRATGSGRAYNVGPGTVTVLISTISVDTVNNTTSIGGGVDGETDDEYLFRFRSYLLGLGMSNKYGIIYGALLNESLRSANIVEHFPPKSGLYNFTLYLDDGTGTVAPEIIESVRGVIDGNGTKANRGYRAAGINCDILAPSVLSIDVVADVVISYAISIDEANGVLASKLASFVNDHIIDQTVIRSKMQKVFLDQAWVLDMNLTTPLENTAVSSGQIARIGTITLNIVQTEV